MTARRVVISRVTDDEVHEPTFSGTTSDEWGDPQLEDFSADELSAVDDYVLLSASGPRRTFRTRNSSW